MNEKEQVMPPATGGISLLVVFAVLCMTVFALMSLSTVQANRRLSDASLQAVADYYTADCEALRILAQLLDGDIPEGVSREADIYAYTCPISGTQDLEVEVTVNPDGGYQILRWQAVPRRGETGGGGMELWDGTLPF